MKADYCVACSGDETQCKGGGNRRCRKRNPRASRLAGVLDTYGGIRFVVAHRTELRHHVRCDELLFVVPRLIVHEPIAWNDIPIVIARIELEFGKWLDTRPNLDEAGSVAVQMYKLRCLEHTKRSLDLHSIVET
jgi:hypothetical protein